MFAASETERKATERERDKKRKKHNYDRPMSSCSLNKFLKLRKFLEKWKNPFQPWLLSGGNVLVAGITVFAFWLSLVMAAEYEFGFCTQQEKCGSKWNYFLQHSWSLNTYKSHYFLCVYVGDSVISANFTFTNLIWVASRTRGGKERFLCLMFRQ